MLVLRDMWQLYRQHYGVPLQDVELMVSCESVPFKQGWITEHHKPQVLFQDMNEMGEGTGIATDLYSGQPVDIPCTDIYICGIECDSVSSLNKDAAKHREVVKTGEGRTGRTARAALRHLQATMPSVVIFENVKNLFAKAPDGVSNLEVILDSLKELGYSTKALLLDAIP